MAKTILDPSTKNVSSDAILARLHRSRPTTPRTPGRRRRSWKTCDHRRCGRAGAGGRLLTAGDLAFPSAMICSVGAPVVPCAEQLGTMRTCAGEPVIVAVKHVGFSPSRLTRYIPPLWDKLDLVIHSKYSTSPILTLSLCMFQ